MTPDSLETVAADVVASRKCERLVAWRELVAREKRASFRDEAYWGKPVPPMGDPNARLLIVGLAPAAHGGNRTGRIFTGDRSGDWLFASMYRNGFASQPTSTHIGDGLVLIDAYVTAVVHCAPPDNKPTPEERDNCLPYLVRELDLLTNVRVIVCLGGYALNGVSRALGLRPFPKFGHGVEVPLPDPDRRSGSTIVCSFHPSQQNTFTGLLTEEMLDGVFARARELAEA